MGVGLPFGSFFSSTDQYGAQEAQKEARDPSRETVSQLSGTYSRQKTQPWERSQSMGAICCPEEEEPVGFDPCD